MDIYILTVIPNLIGNPETSSGTFGAALLHRFSVISNATLAIPNLIKNDKQ
ncbi:MAG: hypothetical protein H8D63_01525 [Parcubacteria group bacterium]|nr:hypothetical protein [Parcubacteria group bacterium]